MGQGAGGGGEAAGGAQAAEIRHEERGGRGAFFVERDGSRVAELTYQRAHEGQVTVDHTFVDPSLRGGGVARQLLDAAVAWARAGGVKIDPTCSYARKVLLHDPAFRDLLA